MLPGVTSKPLFTIVPVSVATNGVSVSVCSKSVVWLLNSHVILSTGEVCTASLKDHNSRGTERCCGGII